MTKWTADEIPDQSGRTFVVTGANSGLGEVSARELARAGANVILACRNVTKGEAAAGRMSGSVEVRRLDLADLSSVRAFAKDIDTIDVLVNNAGVMAIPLASTTDGFEMQIGTNHLGHFALTGLLLPAISDRVVTLSSGAHRFGHIAVDDLNWRTRRYHAWPAYGQAKLANLMFAYEFQRRLSATGSPVKSLAAHPGYAATELQSHTESVLGVVMKYTNKVFAQSAGMGALPTLYAATKPDVPGGAYIGPGNVAEMRGHPKIVDSSRASKDEAVAGRLWALSQELTGVSYLD